MMEVQDRSPTDPVVAKLTAVFRDAFDNDGLNLRPELTAADLPGWDSMMQLRLILMIEGEFDIRLPSSEVTELRTVGDMIALIHTCLRAA